MIALRKRKKKKIKHGVASTERSKLMRRMLGNRECWGQLPAPDGEPFRPPQGRHQAATIHSAAWATAQFPTIDDRDADGNTISVTLYNPRLGPPRADSNNCRMVVCRCCGVPTPVIAADTARGQLIAIDGFNAESQQKIARVILGDPVGGRAWHAFLCVDGFPQGAPAVSLGTVAEVARWLRKQGSIRQVETRSGICLDCHVSGMWLEKQAEMKKEAGRQGEASWLMGQAKRRRREEVAWGPSPWRTFMETARALRLVLRW